MGKIDFFLYGFIGGFYGVIVVMVNLLLKVYVEMLCLWDEGKIKEV